MPGYMEFYDLRREDGEMIRTYSSEAIRFESNQGHTQEDYVS